MLDVTNRPLPFYADEGTLALIQDAWAAAAREDFWTFRCFVRPDMVRGWWLEDEARHLQQFYEDLIAGKRPILALSAPPQHGKSWSVVDFIAWCMGKHDDLPTIFGSYSDRLGVRANTLLQRMIESPAYQLVFPKTQLPPIGSRSHQRTATFFELTNGKTSFRNTTVNGPINGEGLRLGVIDDPVKGRAEASSPTIRETTWNWLLDDFYSRFTDDAGLLIIMTRWHVDDPVGRLLKAFPEVKELRYPAIAEEDGPFRKKGEALFPNYKPLDFLLKRKALYTIGSWSSLYQQNPIVVGGGLFPIEKFKVMRGILDKREIKLSIRYWDKAGTEGGGAFTSGVLMHSMKDGTFVVEHVARGQWSALKREQIIKTITEVDNKFRAVTVWVEQEPGSGGKESAENTIRMLAGYSVYADKVTDAKNIRWEPYAAQVQAGNVSIMPGEWNMSFLDEHEVAPNGKYKDTVDAAAGAFMKLVAGLEYDVTGSWIG